MGAASTMSPGGKYLCTSMRRALHWFTQDIATGVRVNLTERLPVKFCDETHDTPEPARPASAWPAGPTATSRCCSTTSSTSGKSVRTARTPRNVTGGEGRKQSLVFRYRTFDDAGAAHDPDRQADAADDDQQRDARRPATTASPFTGGAPEKIVMMDKAMGALIKAKNADVVVFTAVDASTSSPTTGSATSTFASPKKITNANPQQAEFVWGKAENIKYINADGKVLTAMLIKPDNFDPTKKYPMMVYIYEELTQGLHGYRAPNVGHEHQHHALREQRLRRAAAGHRLRDRLSGSERDEVRDSGDQHRRGAGLHRSEAHRHPGPLVGRLPDHLHDHADEHLRARCRPARRCRT